ncbi:mutase-like protein [Seminavis robusta]|uniref:Mutase-like protein n=1 Tax=Seminavis robusta TaxID=568900 RepID=A0A9N8HUH2_9STRA|nr:mutase-like protein [Seminavis robusta]|eukprot:Sro2078_g313690.1 mutase-like protein (331) ;mRNA; r:17339-18331
MNRRLFLPMVSLLLPDSAVSLSNSATKSMSTKASNLFAKQQASGKWSAMNIQTAEELTISVRQKLQDEGVIGVDRPVRIIGEPIERPDQLLKKKDSTNKTSTTTKILHFQRHGQGFHNTICALWRELTGTPVDLESTDPAQNPLLRLDVMDSPLTELGRQQCLKCKDDASLLNPELVIVSPLLRAIQSAELSWSAHRHNNNNNNKVPWVAHEQCREDLGLLVCNQRRTIAEIQKMYPDIDFSLCVDNEDTLFMPDRLETPLETTQRAYEFLVDHVRTLPQTEIAIVGHSSWLFGMCNAVMDIPDESLRTWFLTSEIRSMQVTFEDDQSSS